MTGFAIKLEPGGSATYTVGSVISSGTLTDVNNGNGASISGLTVGNWYALESSGGPVILGVGPGYDVYDFGFSPDAGATWIASFGLAWVGNYVYATGPAGWPMDNLNPYARAYFQAGAITCNFRFNGFGYAWGGSLGWTLRNAIATPTRRILLNSALLYNICSP